MCNGSTVTTQAQSESATIKSYSQLLAMAWPFIVANASVPLLGVVDTAVIGNTGSVIDLGAIALGALIFSFVYWSFGFLRMGTTGFVAQAKGAGDAEEVRAIFGRASLIALAVGMVLLLLQLPIGAISFRFYQVRKQSNPSLAPTFIRVFGERRRL